MASYKYANNPQTTLSGAIAAGSTSISVASGSLFPSAGRFTVIVDAEIMLVTGVAGTTWTVERGHDGTVAAAHNNNATVTGILTRESFLNSLYFDVRAYGAIGDGVTDDTSAIQEAITDAFTAGGTVVFPEGDYKVTSTLATPLDVAGTVKLVGAGRPKGLTGGHSGDPTTDQGATIVYTGLTGDIFNAKLTSGAKRQYITIEGLSLRGNPAGTSGHGLHFEATAVATVAILVTLRDVTVNDCADHGIFFDGNVFEGQLFNVRSSQNGDAGFCAAASGSGLPGETRSYGCTFNVNAVGVQISGGGQFSFYGLTATQNTNQGLAATGVGLSIVDANIEINGAAYSEQITLTSLTGATIIGLNMTVNPASTAIGVNMVSCLWVHIIRFSSNFSTAGAGYRDFVFADTSSRCVVDEYSPDDFIGNFTIGVGGGHIVRQGGAWLSAQTHAQQSATSTTTETVTFNATRYDSFLSTITVASQTVTIGNPTMGNAHHNGQRITVHTYNNTAGTASWLWGAQWHLAGAWVNPAAGKTRTITFEWDATRAGFYEVGRSAADIT